jgi:hypothetical protein
MEISVQTPKQTISYPDDPTLTNPTPTVAKIVINGNIVENYDAKGNKIGTEDLKDTNHKELYASYLNLIMQAKKDKLNAKDICTKWFNLHAGATQGTQAQAIIKNAAETSVEPYEDGTEITVAQTPIPPSANKNNTQWQNALTPTLAKVVSHIKNGTMQLVNNIYLDAKDEIFGFTNYEFGDDGSLQKMQTVTYETSPTAAKFTNYHIKTFENVVCEIY